MPKITLIGAGSMTFAKNLIGDIISYPELAGAEICLMDINPERLQMSVQLGELLMSQKGGNQCTIFPTTDRRAALKGAHYVITAFQAGGLKAYEKDIEIPAKYGVSQCVGDTLNPGGIFRGLRTIPVMQAIAREMAELCPDAVLLQYNNPMAISTWGTYASAPDLKVVGLCHSVQGTAQMLADWIGAPMEQVSYRCAGINHMAWFLEYKWQGKDAYPLIREAVKDPVRYGKEPIRIDLLRHFGYFVTESSGHASEYNPWFRKRPEVLAQTVAKFTDPGHDWLDWGRGGGYLKHCYRELEMLPPRRERWIKGEEPVPFKRSHEYGIQIIHAMETNTPTTIYGNVRNTGLVTNLPADACVEVPVLVDGTGLRPIYVGNLPPQLAALNRTNVGAQELAVTGSLLGDRELVKLALAMDPLTGAVCSLDEIEAMTRELFEAHAQWLPQFQ
ncbi:MAG: alpha-glucosidase/alpha-galactosidase [Mycobacterium leprae]